MPRWGCSSGKRFARAGCPETDVDEEARYFDEHFISYLDEDDNFDGQRASAII